MKSEFRAHASCGRVFTLTYRDQRDAHLADFLFLKGFRFAIIHSTFSNLRNKTPNVKNRLWHAINELQMRNGKIAASKKF